MKAKIKTDFEKYLIAQCTADGTKYYFMAGSIKVYVYFEGQNITVSDNYIQVSVVPLETSIIGVNTKYHAGNYRFYIYTKNIQNGDTIADALAAMLQDKRIEQTTGFLIDTQAFSVRQRGNKFENSTHYEVVADLGFRHWEC